MLQKLIKNENKLYKNIPCMLQSVDSTRFISSSLSNLVNKLLEGIYNIKCKYRHDNKKYETCRIKYNYCDCFLEYINFKVDLIK